MVIGPSRVGKGTLLTAFTGIKMGFVSSEDQDGEEFQSAATNMIMAPIIEEEAVPHAIISHYRNSHTLAPTLFYGPDFPKTYKGLNGNHLIDFPGMFDSRGDEISMAIDLALQMIIKRAKSTKILLMLSAFHFLADNQSILQNIIHRLNFMF